MRKNSEKILAAGLVFLTAVGVVFAVPYTGKATGSIVLDETPLAGITLSLDYYCDNVLQEAEEEAELAEQEEQQMEETEEEETEEQEAQEEEKSKIKLHYKRLGLVDVDTYLNVRKHASQSSKIVGKMTKNTGCNILSIKKGWAKIKSGKVTGYVKAKYLLRGEKAEKKAIKVATLKAVVKTETLNVRYLPSTDSRIYDQISEDEFYTVEKKNLTKEYMKKYIARHCSKKDTSDVDMSAMYEDLDNWAMLSIDNEKVFVSKDFISMRYTLNHAVKIKSAKKGSSASASSASSSKGSSIVSYAMQFLGNRYVWGGTSLTNGTDCSGFTMSIYRHFGYSLPRTSSAQASATRTVSSSDVQVGDLFFYGSGSVSHVALYIGNGQIIHASNARDGIKISSAYYRQPIKIGRVM